MISPGPLLAIYPIVVKPNAYVTLGKSLQTEATKWADEEFSLPAKAKAPNSVGASSAALA
jgi:hypothetical protein